MTTRTISSSSFYLLPLVSLLLHTGCDNRIFTGKREARGVWMSRFEYAVDSARANPEISKAIIRSVFERARKARLNMVFFQVRGNADAFYRSSLEPWSAMLSDSLGKDPGWDPLAFAVEEAHRLGLELHAWVNTFPVWRGPGLPQETFPRPVVLEHPEWIVCDSSGTPMPLNQNGYIWGSPGNPDLRKHIVGVVKEIAGNYDVDGIHFDYIRYPDGSTLRGYSRDSVSVARFESAESNPSHLPWEYWQREQVNEFIGSAYDSVTGMKPWVKISAAVIGKYDGSGWTSYHAVYQDPYRWMEREKIDFIVPMVYWERSHPTHPFIPLIAQWHDRIANKRPVLPGLSTGLQDKFGWSELSEQIRAVRKQGLPGVVFFASGGLKKAWEILQVDEFPYWSLPPTMPWKDSIPPLPPVDLAAVATESGITLTWRADTTEPLSYVVYRFSGEEIGRNNVLRILALTRRNATTFIDDDPLSGPATYVVSSVDRMSNESATGAILEMPVVALNRTSPKAVATR